MICGFSCKTCKCFDIVNKTRLTSTICEEILIDLKQIRLNCD